MTSSPETHFREKVIEDDASSIIPDVTKILCVGRACLDIVQTCQQFPMEDSTQRSTIMDIARNRTKNHAHSMLPIGTWLSSSMSTFYGHRGVLNTGSTKIGRMTALMLLSDIYIYNASTDYRWQRGGNASNTCTVLSLLGQSCELLACLSADEHADFMQNDLCKYKIDYSHCPMIKGIGCPIATIILSLNTRTRTIVYHNQNLPELTVKNFEQLNLAEYSWVHFEGRNIDEMLLMIQRIENYNESLNGSKNHMPIMISVELENPRSGPRLLDLLSHTDVTFVAKDFAKKQGFNDMKEVIHTIGQDVRLRGAIICAWAEEGAIARTPCGVIVQSPAFPPHRVIDTLGAGDTFNAAVLYYLNKSKVEFMRKYKDEAHTAYANDTNKLCEDTFDSSTVVRRDIKRNLNIENLKYNRTKFIDETVLQRAIKFACYIAGAKVGSRGYDCLDKICTRILQLDFSIL